MASSYSNSPRSGVNLNDAKPHPLSRGNSMSSEPSSDYATAALYLHPLLEVISQELDRREQSSTPKKRHITNLPPEEKRQRRLQRNRVAAKECRKKKKEYVEKMEKKLAMLELQNTTLRSQLQELEAKLTLGLMRVKITQGRHFSLKDINFSSRQ